MTVVCREARISPHDGEPDQIVVSVETTIADLGDSGIGSEDCDGDA